MRSRLFGLLSLSILALVLMVNLVSAAITLTPISIPQTANHNSAVTVTFNLTADTQNYTNLNWLASTTDVGSWSSLPSSTTLNNGETKTFSAILSIPKYTSGTINANINVVASPNNPSDDLSFSIIIADSSSLSVSSAEISEGQTSTTITIKNEGNVPLNNIVLTPSGDFEVDLSSTTISSLAVGDTQDIDVTITTPLSNLHLGTNIVTISATSTEGAGASGTVSTTRPYCEYNNPGALDFIIDDIEVKEGFGDNEDYWYLFDEIGIDVDLDGGTWDIENIEIEWELYANGKRIMRDSENDFDLDSNEDKSLTIDLKLDQDIDDFENQNAMFYVRATGRIDDKDAGLSDGNKTCAWVLQEVEVETSDDFVILDDIQLPEIVSCGEDVQILADVWNIGDDEQEEVYVNIYNNELGIDKDLNIGDIDAFDNLKLDTIITIPQNMEEKYYSFIFQVYDDNDDIFENNNNDEAEYILPLKVEGNCIETAMVSASLESEAKAGKEIIIKADITNTGNKLVTYDLDISGYAEWASLISVEPGMIILDAGESREVLITLDVNKDVSGDKLFDIEVLLGDELITKQPVSVTIEKSRFNLPGITGNVIKGDNWYLWGIGALNLILVIVIVIVALRVMKKEEE
jgi:uncharacterized membrane protein